MLVLGFHPSARCLGNRWRGIYALILMPERSFGRTVRYRRTQLGLSQAKLAELVGRSTPTIRSWERDKSRPNDPQVLSALAAILGVDERQLFEKVDLERPASVETSPTVEQALATLSAEKSPVREDRVEIDEPDPDTAPPESVDEYRLDLVELEADYEEGDSLTREPAKAERVLVPSASVRPAYVAPPDPYVQTPITPTLADASYIEDSSQRQLYRVRNLATLVAVVAMIIAFVWALGEGLGALGDWWDDFFGDLRL